MNKLFQHGNTLLRQAAATTLISVGCIGKPITKHHLATGQSRANDLGQVLCARGKHQQQFGVGTHGFITGSQQQFANALGQRSAARLAGQQYLNALRAQLCRQVFAIGTFASTFRTFKGDKQASHR